MGTKVSEVIRALGESADLERVLEGAGMTPARVLAMVQGKEGRRQLAARKALGRLQVELLAHRYGALAMYKLCGMLNEEDRGLRLKGAMAVLGAMGEKFEMRNAECEMEKKEEVAEEEEDEDVQELLAVVADVLGERRRLRLMAPADDENSKHEATKSTKLHEEEGEGR